MAENEEPAFPADLTVLISNAELDRLLAELGAQPRAGVPAQRKRPSPDLRVNVEMSIMPPEPPQQHGDAELMLDHSIDFGLVEVHAPRLNPIKRVPPSQLRD